MWIAQRAQRLAQARKVKALAVVKFGAKQRLKVRCGAVGANRFSLRRFGARGLAV